MFNLRNKALSIMIPFLLVACGKAKDASGNKEAYGSSSKVANAGAVNSLSPNSFVPDRVFFDFDSASVTSEGKESLKVQAKFLIAEKLSITVEGHADERGTDAYNMSLGLKRAQSAKAELVKLGVSAAKIKVVTFGKHKPAVNGDSEDAHAKNRRAVTVVVAK